jgi:tRNA(Ile)-lysidine synthase
LRGADSDADAEFVVAAAAELEVRSVVGSGDVIGRVDREGDGIEAAARAARYDFLAETAARFGCRYVATAHTLDDQAETVLHRILRGTGPAGLAGIPRVRPLVPETIGLVRPLLGFRRSEVRDYLRAIGRTWREDASNDDLRFTRNRIRRELLPQLAADYNPRIVESLARLAGQAEEYREIIDGLVTPVYERAIVTIGEGGWTIDGSRLAGVPRPIVRELLVRVWTEAGLPLRAMGYDEWSSLAAMAADENAATRDFPGGVAVRREGDRLIATRPG